MPGPIPIYCKDFHCCHGIVAGSNSGSWSDDWDSGEGNIGRFLPSAMLLSLVFFPPFAISGSVYNRYRAYERISFFVYKSVWRSRLNLWDAFILLGYMFCLPSFPQPFDRPFPSKFGKLCSLTRLPRSELRVRFP